MFASSVVLETAKPTTVTTSSAAPKNSNTGRKSNGTRNNFKLLSNNYPKLSRKMKVDKKNGKKSQIEKCGQHSKQKLIALKEIFRKLKHKYKDALNKEIEAEAKRISDLDDIEIKNHLNCMLAQHNKKILELRHLLKEQMTIKEIADNYCEKGKEIYGYEPIYRQRAIQQNLIEKDLLSFSNKSIHNNLTWNKLQILSELSIENMKYGLRITNSSPKLPNFIVQIDDQSVSDDLNHVSAPATAQNSADELNLENFLVVKKPVFFDEEDSSTITSCESPNNHKLPIVAKPQLQNHKSVPQNSSVLVSTEINGVVYCRGDELKVMKNNKTQYVGKLLSISDSKLLIKDQKNRTRYDINIKDVRNGDVTLILSNNYDSKLESPTISPD